MQKACEIDDMIYRAAALRREKTREFWRNRILEIEEINLFDYERPLKVILCPRTPLISRVKYFIKTLIP